MTDLRLRSVSKSFAAAGAAPAVDRLSLLVPPGSSVAIVGPNGAGKSTVLRLIAGILAPTSGAIHRPRRCTSLIELGAGFHPDLTARENLDLGLALAGVSGRELRRRREDAIDFTGLGSAIDLPVKHLSSGMLGRLACSVAVHSDPDLLLVDEVLAVGDHAFQREMLSSVDRLICEGTTLMIVTHSLDLASAVAERTVWLSGGRLVEDGPSDGVLSRYEATVRGFGRSFGPRVVQIERLVLEPDHVEPGGPLRVVADLRCASMTGPLHLRLEARPVAGDDTTWMRAEDEDPEVRQVNLLAATPTTPIGSLSEGRHRIELDMPAVRISPSQLELTLLVADADRLIIDELSCNLDVGHASLRPHYHLEVATGATAWPS